MNLTSAELPRGASEFEHAGLELAPSRLVAPPRVAAAPVSLECKVTQVVQIADGPNIVTFGQVVGVHVDEAAIVDGRVDLTRLKPIARCGYRGDYTVVDSLFEMLRP
jgi:flavin reductase (DIM6/NTAB) family NADH-FMN oxidoreductase RutF